MKDLLVKAAVGSLLILVFVVVPTKLRAAVDIQVDQNIGEVSSSYSN